MTDKERLHKETLDEVMRIKGSLDEIRISMQEADYSEVVLGVDSLEFYLKLKEIDKAVEELQRILTILRRYNGENGAIGSFTRL